MAIQGDKPLIGPIQQLKLRDDVSIKSFEHNFDKAISKDNTISKKDFQKLSKLVVGGEDSLKSFLVANNIVVGDDVSKLSSISLKPSKVKISIDKARFSDALLRGVEGGKGDYIEKEQAISKATDLTSLKEIIKDKKITKSEYTRMVSEGFVKPDVQAQMSEELLLATLDRPSSDPQKFDGKQQLLRKILFTMGGDRLKLRSDDGEALQPWKHNLSSALTHGGRVNLVFQTPNEARDFLNWIKGDLEDERTVFGVIPATSTHGIERSTTPNANNVLETYQEESFTLGGVTSGSSNMGVNIPMGGAGNSNLFGESLDDDGHFGHLLISSNLSGEPAVIMIGIEGSQPRKTNQFGGSHGASGASNDISAAGLQKWQDMDLDDNDKPAKYTGMVVDLREQGKSAALMAGFTIANPGNESLVKGTKPMIEAAPQEPDVLKHPELIDV